jgi:hypothetical protein
MVIYTDLWWSSRANAFLARIETTYFKSNFTNMVVSTPALAYGASVRLAKNMQGYSTTEYL